jgi:membrane-associated protein
MILDRILLMKISTIETFGYVIVLLATFLEASPLLGLLIPGSIVIFFAGFAAKLGFLSFKIVFFFAALGAILGDLGGYLFGRYAGKEFLHKYGKYLLIKREYIDISCDLAHEHTGKSLVIGRINPITRSAAPFIVGCHKVSWWKFMLFNVLGGLLWAFLFVSLGYIFGHGYVFAIRFERWIILATIALIGILYLRYFMKLLTEKSDKCDYIDFTKNNHKKINVRR